MSRKSISPKERHHVWLYQGDWEYITDHFGDGAPPEMRLGAGATIAEIVHAKVLEMKAREIQRIERVTRSHHDDEWISSNEES